jgi:EAL domain-containing protein (putative c-di-GMP-specific phosphodiesterase class I)
LLALLLPYALVFGGLTVIGAAAGASAFLLWRRQAGPRAVRAGTAPEQAPAVPSLADDLHDAVTRNEFFLVHQPKMRARSGEVAAVETLVRWRHPTRGLIGPNDFIALAEEKGEMRRITEWVIRQAIVEQASLAACGHALTFNVNISARVLPDRDFAEWALATVSAASGPIGFEITETAMIADPEGALRNLHVFADAGIKIAIDDYGAGLSSLAYLKQLPAHELKIDRMFISGLSSSHRDPLLVRSTIDLAHALDMEVTAEGVDSPAALALLKVMGCDVIQGFLIAMPMALGDLRAFLDAREDATPEASLGFNWLGRAGRVG